METISPAMSWATVLSFASAFVLLATAAEKIIAAWKAAKAPNNQQNKRLDELETWRQSVDTKLIRDNERLGSMEEGNRATQRALLALLDHGIDGNNIKQMKDAKETLESYLINR